MQKIEQVSMTSSEGIKKIKARIFLNQNIHDNEIFSIAIDAKNNSNQKSFDQAIKLLGNPLSKQSNILLLELFRVAIKKNDEELSLRLLKILLAKTNQSFVIYLAIKSENIKLRSRLIEAIKHNKKLKPKNKIYLFYMLWKMKKVSRRTLYILIKSQLDMLVDDYKYRFSSTLGSEKATFDERTGRYEFILRHENYLLEVMRGTILLAKIGNAGKAIDFFKEAFAVFVATNPDNYQNYFKNNNEGWGLISNKRKFTDGICDIDNITQYLKTDYKDFFDTPFNQSELEIQPLINTNALNFASEFSRYTNSPDILRIVFPIHCSKKFIHKNIFGYLRLIEKINKHCADRKLVQEINDYFFKSNQHFSSKIAFLGLSKNIRQKFKIDENKIKDNFSNKIINGKLDGLYRTCSYRKRFIYSGKCNNCIAFKSVYEIADNNIRDWLEDLFIAKRLTRYDGIFSPADFNTETIENFIRMFDAKISKIFEESIKKKLSRLSEKKIISSRFFLKAKSIVSGSRLLKKSRKTREFEEGILFMKTIRTFPSRKFIANKNKYSNATRSAYVAKSRRTDYFSSREFRSEFNKFIRAFLKLKRKDQKKLWPLGFGHQMNDFVVPFCDRKTYSEYLKQNPYCAFTSDSGKKSVVMMIRLRKAKEKLSQLSNQKFKNEYKKFVSMKMNKNSFSKNYTFDLNALILHFLEEATSRFTLSEVKEILRKDLNNWSKGKQIEILEDIKQGGRLFGPRYETTPVVAELLKDIKDEIIIEIKSMDCEELANNFDEEQIKSLVNVKDSGLNAFLLEKIPHKVIYELVEEFLIFERFAMPPVLEKGLKRSIVKSSIRDACKDLSIGKTFDFQKIWFAKSIINKFDRDNLLDRFEYWDKECLQIIEESVAPIYENLANICLESLKKLNLESKKEASSFVDCLGCITDIQGDLPGIKDFKKRQILIYQSIEAAAKELLKRDKISNFTAKAFLDFIDRLLRFDMDTAKIYLGTKDFKRFKTLLKNCAFHLIKVKKVSNKSFFDKELSLEIMKNYLQSMNAFDPKYKTALNQIPLSRDIVEYSRKYNAPYWANSLKIYNY